MVRQVRVKLKTRLHIWNLNGAISLDDLHELGVVVIAPAAQMESEREIGRHERFANHVRVLGNHFLWLGACEQVEVDDATDGDESDRRRWLQIDI